jgi:hypothetical protein
MATEAQRIRIAAADVNRAKRRAQYVLEHWDTLPDVDASSGELERAIELLGIVERDLNDDADGRQS